MATIGTLLFTRLRGRLVARDDTGNAYYEERSRRRAGRPKRWVIYGGKDDASSVPPEWWGWIHHTSEAPLPPTVRKSWQIPFEANQSGTAEAYRPPGHDYQGGRRTRAPGDYEAWSPDQ